MGSQSILKILIGVGVGVAGIALFQNCGRAGPSASYASAKAAVTDGRVLPDPKGTSSNRAPAAAAGAAPAPGPTTLPVDLFCSMDGARAIGASLSTAGEALTYAFIDEAGAEVCAVTELNARRDLINTGAVTIPDLPARCPALRTGAYQLSARTAAGDRSLLMTTADWQGRAGADEIGLPLRVKLAIGADRSITLTPVNPNPCWNADAGPMYQAFPGQCAQMYGVNPAKILWSGTVGWAGCARFASLLVVRLGHLVSSGALTSPLDGVRLDIVGANAEPPHAPHAVSWFARGVAAETFVLALPDAAGAVRGIDQLFGDNTTGPDGSTPAKNMDPGARDGFAALAQWDGRGPEGIITPEARDGAITRDDDVFAKLRLWADANGDGIAQANELTTLDDHGVVRIDLEPRRDAVETDAWGNQVRAKSVVQTRDQNLHPVHDLWVRALPVPTPAPAAPVARVEEAPSARKPAAAPSPKRSKKMSRTARTRRPRP